MAEATKFGPRSDQVRELEARIETITHEQWVTIGHYIHRGVNEKLWIAASEASAHHLPIGYSRAVQKETHILTRRVAIQRDWFTNLTDFYDAHSYPGLALFIIAAANRVPRWATDTLLQPLREIGIPVDDLIPDNTPTEPPAPVFTPPDPHTQYGPRTPQITTLLQRLADIPTTTWIDISIEQEHLENDPRWREAFDKAPALKDIDEATRNAVNSANRPVIDLLEPHKPHFPDTNHYLATTMIGSEAISCVAMQEVTPRWIIDTLLQPLTHHGIHLDDLLTDTPLDPVTPTSERLNP